MEWRFFHRYFSKSIDSIFGVGIIFILAFEGDRIYIFFQSGVYFGAVCGNRGQNLICAIDSRQLGLFDIVRTMIKIFFGGIIQGSNKGLDIHGQDYRQEIKNLIRQNLSHVRIFDPFEGHEMSVHYDDRKARQTFFEHLNYVRDSDLMIAYLPQASLGTAIEMWEAHRHNVPILSISPMTTNWIIRLLPVRNFETIDGFKTFINKGGLIEIADLKSRVVR